MKARRVLIAATALVVMVAAVWMGLGSLVYGLLDGPLTLAGAVGVRFAGFGKGQPGAFTGARPSHYDAFVREWLASGTNMAVFTVTNGQNRGLLLYPYAGFCERTNAGRSRYETILPASGDGHGVLVRPGEAITIRVAILPREGPGFVRFGFVPNYRDPVPRAIEELRALVDSGKPATFPSEWIYSERIVP